MHADTFANLYSFTLTHPELRTRDEVICVALLVYSTFTLTNKLRHGTVLEQGDIYDALCQGLREGARGHKEACSVLDTRWARNGATRPIPPCPLMPYHPQVLKLRQAAVHRASRRQRD